MRATERILKTKTGELSPLDQGKSDALRTLRMVTDEENLTELSLWTNARRHLPTFARHGQTPRSRIIFVEGFISCKWKEQHREEENFPFALLEETLPWQDGAQHKRRIRIQDLVRHTMVLCGAEAPSCKRWT